MCLWLQTDQTQLLFHFPLDQPCSQGSLSCFEKDQTLVMWKWIMQQGQVPHYILLTGLWNTVWGREKILSSKQCLSFWVGFKVCCFRLVSIALFWRKIGYLFREFVLEKRFACCSGYGKSYVTRMCRIRFLLISILCTCSSWQGSDNAPPRRQFKDYYVISGAYNPGRATPILGLCHSIFTGRFMFRHILGQFFPRKWISAMSMNAFEV